MTTLGMAWIGIGLPFRPSGGTYNGFSYEELPPVDSLAAKFAFVKKFEGEEFEEMEELFIDSPTSCYFKDGAYHDQQGCVVWRVASDGSVVTDGNWTVAKSVPEFLARITMENSIWFSVTSCSHNSDLYSSMDRLFGNGKLADPKGLMLYLKSVLDPEQYAYITPYYKKYIASL